MVKIRNEYVILVTTHFLCKRRPRETLPWLGYLTTACEFSVGRPAASQYVGTLEKSLECKNEMSPMQGAAVARSV
jgi:hypothetical protein